MIRARVALPNLGAAVPMGRMGEPAGVAAYLADEGVDIALLMSEYSPKVTGIQMIEDNLPLVRFNPRRFT